MAEPEPGAFRIVDAGIQPAGADEPTDTDAVISADEPARVAVSYTDAGEGVELLARWNVEGRDIQDMRITLSGDQSTHVFGAPAPAGGWPDGRHQVLLTVDGAIVAAVHFTVGA